MEVLLLILGITAGTVLCLFAMLCSIHLVKSHKGEIDEVRGPIVRHRVLLNPHYLVYVFFALFTALIIGFFAWLFK